MKTVILLITHIWSIHFCSIIFQCLTSIGWLIWVATWKLWSMLQLVSCQARFSSVSLYLFQHPEKYSKAICCVASYPIATVWEMMSNIKSRGSGTVPFALSKGKVLFSERWAGPTTQTINLTLKTCHQQERNITRRTKENQAQSLGKHPCRRHKMWGPQGLFCCHTFGGKSLQKGKRSVTSLQNQIQVVMIRTRWLKKTSLVCWKCCSFQVPCCKEEKHLSQDSRGRCCLTRTSFTDQVTDTWCQMTRGKLRFEVEIYALVAVKKYWCCIFITLSDPTL